jgi:SAM-dependent methyltransferase
MQLEPTGERLVEEHYLGSPGNYLIYLFHVIAYDFARRYVAGKEVLDYGCGSGFGTHRLAADCARIVGVDIAPDAVRFAAERYRAPNLTFQVIAPADRAPLPFADGSFDTVLSFQVIEHLVDPGLYLAEIRRVLRPGGAAIFATPDRATRLFPGQKPWNQWHVDEFDAAGLEACLAAYFERVEMLHLGGRPEVLGLELRRTRALKWVTLPITLPFVPEVLRQAGLSALKRLSGRSRRAAAPALAVPPFGVEDLEIAPNASPSVNLIAVAQKS